MSRQQLLLTVSLLLSVPAIQAQQHAKNVILFLGDAGGIPTLSAASIHGYREPRALFIQHMPYIALSETSSTSSWVTDSAAGMTAIVTGRKTANGVLSENPPADSHPGAPLKTILEYAEEHGLSTGVISNKPMVDATPAACYAHVDSRKKFGEILQQVWKPRFGDGVDLVIGNGRKEITESAKEMGIDLERELRASGRYFYDSLDAVPADAKRVVALFDDANFDVDRATAKAIQILSGNPKGFFLMVEWDLHPSKPERCLDTVIKLDRLIRRTAKENERNTLVLFTADHSFDFRVVSGKKGSDLKLPTGPNAGKPVPERSEDRPNVVIGTSHSGEEVLVAAEGPGAERVKGVLSNTDLFGIMLAAYGWRRDAR
ncbi:MAG TPA: alkaline phosphatase [Bryobacteraceae bacterium]|nr:alkaline phosphatase [Bryobacteraceae bacterium]